MSKAFFISKAELDIIVEAIAEKIEIFQQVVEDNPAEKPFLEELIELHADLENELKYYDNSPRERLGLK